jgi:Acyl-coenzyme A:6-aminopenicillanic acid acyl-transferase
MRRPAELPWLETPTLHLDLDLPPAQRFAAIPPEALDAGRRLLAAILDGLPPQTETLADLARLRTVGRFNAEIEALADTIGVPWRSVMLANLIYDLAVASMGCSTIALATADGPVLARNMDWSPEDVLARSSCLVRCERRGRLAFASAGWPGAVGVVSAMSGRGFAVALNAVIGPEGKSLAGYPVLLHLRRVVEDATSFDDALEMLARPTLVVSALFTLIGTENPQRVVIERSPTRFALRRPTGDEPLLTTNDCRLLFAPTASDHSEIYRTTCSRYDALGRLLRKTRVDRAASDAELLYVLGDPEVRQTITAQHVIFRPASGAMGLWVPRDLVA